MLNVMVQPYLLSIKYFYNVTSGNYLQEMFGVKNMRNATVSLGTYAVHFFNGVSKNVKILPGIKQPISLMASQNCPTMYVTSIISKLISSIQYRVAFGSSVCSILATPTPTHQEWVEE